MVNNSSLRLKSKDRTTCHQRVRQQDHEDHDENSSSTITPNRSPTASPTDGSRSNKPLPASLSPYPKLVTDLADLSVREVDLEHVFR